ncbi:MAG: DUF971 domain-containing protein [Bdellovibrionota bacterium]
MASAFRATAIHVEKNGDLLVTWSDGLKATYRALDLRDACRCAGCRDERTGEKILDRKAIRTDIYPDVIEPVGNYAIAIAWNDGHREGIYSWEYLRELAAPRSGQG